MRPTWEQYFFDIARQVATRATCARKHVGAVLVRDRMILATGYNGSPPGEDHCDTVGHALVNGHCVRTVHAEVNAIAQAARTGVNTANAALYCTLKPCWECLKVLVSAGVHEIYYLESYGSEYPCAIRVRPMPPEQEQETLSDVIRGGM